ncbi:GPAA1-like protein, partial [Mya arenaria]
MTPWEFSRTRSLGRSWWILCQNTTTHFACFVTLAALCGVVENGFYFDFDYNSYISELKEELKKDKKFIPRDWLYNKFREAGLETYTHNYTVKYPLHIVRGQLVPGQNVYGILRARRAPRVEAVVMSVPLRGKSSELQQTYGSLVLMLGLAKYFIRQPYWSKDIIFLATDHEQIGMQAWLDGYHDVHTEYILPGDLPARSGQIQAAINLEIPDGNIRYMNVKMEGLNGQLPNLDLINLVVRLCHRQGVTVMIHDTPDVADTEAETPAGFLQSMTTMGRMMWAQSTGIPSGNHGLFHRYHIEAVTLEAIRKKKTGRVSLDSAGRVIEGIFRSLNNLLERFHQSFFFYLLPGTQRYVSIGLYMIPFAIIADEAKKEGGEPKESPVPKETDDTEKEEIKEISDEIKEKKKLNKETLNELEEKVTGVLSILPLVLSSTIMAVLSYTGPDVLASMAVPFKMNIEDGIFYGFLALFTASLFFPRMVARRTSDDKQLRFDWQLLKAVTLIFQSLVLFGLALMNISLAYFLAVVLSFIAALVSSLDTKHTGILDLLITSWGTLSHGLLLTLVDKYFFGSWMFSLFSFAIFPNWLTLWGISYCD